MNACRCASETHAKGMCIPCYRRDYYLRNRDRLLHAARLRRDDRRIWDRHGVTEEWYRNETANGCAVCGAQKSLHIDHDHQHCPGIFGCGECVRGILCRACNSAIGQMQDDVDRLTKAAAYLARHSPREGR